MSTADDTSPRCAMCQDPSLFVCGRCKDLRFCSIECQEAIWRTHKLLCTKLKNFSRRPAPNMHRILVYPATSTYVKQPEFRWMAAGQDEVGLPRDICSLVAGNSPYMVPVARTNPYTGNAMQHQMQMWCDEETSRSLVGVAEGTGQTVIFCGGEGGEVGPTADISMRDACDVYAWLLEGFMRVAQPLKHEMAMGAKVPGVMLPCDGEGRVLGSKFSKRVAIPRLHPIFFARDVLTSLVSKRIGMPLIAVPYTTERKEWTTKDKRNWTASLLLLGAPPDANGKPASELDLNYFPSARNLGFSLGNVLVAPADQGYLSPQMADAFMDFCSHHLCRYFEWYAQGIEEQPEKRGEYAQAVLDQMTPGVWAKYATQWIIKLKRHEKSPGASAPDDPSIKAGKQKKKKEKGVTDGLIDGVVRMALTEKEGEELAEHLLYQEF